MTTIKLNTMKAFIYASTFFLVLITSCAEKGNNASKKQTTVEAP